MKLSKIFTIMATTTAAVSGKLAQTIPGNMLECAQSAQRFGNVNVAPITYSAEKNDIGLLVIDPNLNPTDYETLAHIDQFFTPCKNIPVWRLIFDQAMYRVSAMNNAAYNLGEICSRYVLDIVYLSSTKCSSYPTTLSKKCVLCDKENSAANQKHCETIFVQGAKILHVIDTCKTPER